jgi:hypothetical protein
MRDLQMGDMANWRVVAHHYWGVEVVLVEDEETTASIDVPYLRDLGPNDYIRGPEDYPPVGTPIRAMVQMRSWDGRLHLTARPSDFALRSRESEHN